MKLRGPCSKLFSPIYTVTSIQLDLEIRKRAGPFRIHPLVISMAFRSA